jgi:hypothetical protein
VLGKKHRSYVDASNNPEPFILNTRSSVEVKETAASRVCQKLQNEQKKVMGSIQERLERLKTPGKTADRVSRLPDSIPEEHESKGTPGPAAKSTPDRMDAKSTPVAESLAGSQLLLTPPLEEVQKGTSEASMTPLASALHRLCFEDTDVTTKSQVANTSNNSAFHPSLSPSLAREAEVVQSRLLPAPVPLDFTHDHRDSPADEDDNEEFETHAGFAHEVEGLEVTMQEMTLQPAVPSPAPARGAFLGPPVRVWMPEPAPAGDLAPAYCPSASEADTEEAGVYIEPKSNSPHQASHSAEGGSAVVLASVRPSGLQREQLGLSGADGVLSPVRRSLRHGSLSALQAASAKALANNFARAYTPNSALCAPLSAPAPSALPVNRENEHPEDASMRPPAPRTPTAKRAQSTPAAGQVNTPRSLRNGTGNGANQTAKGEGSRPRQARTQRDTVFASPAAESVGSIMVRDDLNRTPSSLLSNEVLERADDGFLSPCRRSGRFTHNAHKHGLDHVIALIAHAPYAHTDIYAAHPATPSDSEHVPATRDAARASVEREGTPARGGAQTQLRRSRRTSAGGSSPTKVSSVETVLQSDPTQPEFKMPAPRAPRAAGTRASSVAASGRGATQGQPRSPGKNTKAAREAEAAIGAGSPGKCAKPSKVGRG